MAFFDNFNRADEALGASANWTFVDGTVGLAAVRSNQLAALTGSGQASAYRCPDQGSADHYVQFTVRNITAESGPFVCCRMVNSANFVGIRNSGGFLQVYRRVSDTLTQLHSSNQSIVVGDVLRLECQGTNWTAYKNGVQIATGAIGHASLTNVRQGVVARIVVHNPWIDDFEAGQLALPPITGDVDVVEGEDTVAAAGKPRLVGGATIPEAEDTVSAAGAPRVTGAADIQEAEDTVAAAGSPRARGTADITEDEDTVAAAGAPRVTGTADVTEAEDTVVAAGTLPISGDVDVIEEEDVLAATATPILKGRVEVEEADDTLSTGVVPEEPVAPLRERTARVFPQSRLVAAKKQSRVLSLQLQPRIVLAPHYRQIRGDLDASS